MPQTVRGFAGNVFGADLVAVQTQHLHPGEASHVDFAAKAAQGEVCKMQERSECQTLQEKTISDAEIVKVTIIRSHLKLYMMLPTSGLCLPKNLKNDFSDHLKKATMYNINHNNNHCLLTLDQNVLIKPEQTGESLPEANHAGKHLPEIIGACSAPTSKASLSTPPVITVITACIDLCQPGVLEEKQAHS